jgi:hypothetical protein
MAKTCLILTHGRASDYQTKTGMKARAVVPRLTNLLEGCANGAYPGATGFSVSQTQATGTLTLSSAAGTVGGIINGVTVTVTASGGDIATAEALATAINESADALVNEHVTASNLDADGAASAVVTLTAAIPGPAGNAVTLVASGTSVTASGARLTGGAATSYTF